jgi:hypothetical protein
MIIKILASTLLLTGLATAQTSDSVFVPDNNPTTGTGPNVIPFGQNKTSTTWKNQKYQMLINASYANKVPIRINDLAFAASKTLHHNYDSLVIKIDVVPLTQTALNRTFASNLSAKAVTVLNAKNYTWHVTGAQWNRIGLQKPFLWIPALGHLVIEVESKGGGGAGSVSAGGFKTSNLLERLYAVGWTTNPPATGQGSTSMAALKVEIVQTDAEARPFGAGCAGSNGTPTMAFTGAPQIGKSLGINLTNAMAGSVAIHILGINSSAPLFPVDLAPLGASGCNLYISPNFPFSVGTGTGSIAIKLPVPNNTALVGGRFWNQFIILDKNANNFGWVTSNHGLVFMGN